MSQDQKNLAISVLGAAIWSAIWVAAVWVAGLTQATVPIPVWVLIGFSALVVGALKWSRLTRNRRVYRCNDQLYHEFGDPLVDQASRAGTVWHGVGGLSGFSALIYGPYHGFRPGTYLVAFRMKMSITQPGAYAYFDVAHSAGGGPAQVYCPGTIKADSSGHYRDHLHKVVITKESSSHNWEWRVRLPVAGVEAWADTVTVERISKDTTDWEGIPTTPVT